MIDKNLLHVENLISRGKTMEKVERLILKDLNRLNDEVFRLYFSGYCNEAVKESNNLMHIASEKLGHQHPSMNIFHENSRYMRKNPKDKPKYTNKNILIQKKSRIEDIKRDIMVANYLNDNIELLQKKTFTPNLRRTIIFVCLLLLIGKVAFSAIDIKGGHEITEESAAYSTDANLDEMVEVNYFNNELYETVVLEVPLIMQLPKLPRGCEVTSLAMLLQFAGMEVDKMTLAKEITKDPTPFQRKNGKVFFGNPQEGFVGDMFSFCRPGLGVYYGPILELMEKYMPNQTVNLTGRDFEYLHYFINKGIPVWVITNATFKELGNYQFETWDTPTGRIRITYRMHSVLITGFDEKYIYINDPLYYRPNRKIKRKDFEEAWLQMGSQAISYIPEGKTLYDILPHTDGI